MFRNLSYIAYSHIHIYIQQCAILNDNDIIIELADQSVCISLSSYNILWIWLHIDIYGW